MTLKELMNLLNDMPVEEIKRDCNISGTYANVLKRLITKYLNSLEHAETIGFVGVGCISYAEKRTDILFRRILKLKAL